MAGSERAGRFRTWFPRGAGTRRLKAASKVRGTNVLSQGRVACPASTRGLWCEWTHARRARAVLRCPLVETLSADELLRCLRALGDTTRLRILDLLVHPTAPRAGPVAENEPGLCLSDLEARLALSHPLVSHHVRVLRRAGLVACSRRGRWSLLRVKRGRMAELCLGLERLASLHPNLHDISLDPPRWKQDRAHA
jgi:ArsR family transcriptional regulator, arsenate/arsenite/antimonite-responsive transcriptional repressor